MHEPTRQIVFPDLYREAAWTMRRDYFIRMPDNSETAVCGRNLFSDPGVPFIGQSDQADERSTREGYAYRIDGRVYGVKSNGGAYPVTRDFPLQLAVYPRDVSPPLAELDAVVRLCQAFECTGLVSVDSPDPSSWIRVRSDGHVDQVELNDDALERDEIVVARVLFGDGRAGVAS